MQDLRSRGCHRPALCTDAALEGTDLKPIHYHGYKGVKFDDKGQNSSPPAGDPAAGRRELHPVWPNMPRRNRYFPTGCNNPRRRHRLSCDCFVNAEVSTRKPQRF